jgi:aryl-alcohol dehydrogenase-like predicted oxidoreductase
MDRREALQCATKLAFAALSTLVTSSRATTSSAQDTKSIKPLAPLLTRPIPASGELLPVIGLGTWQTFDIGDDSVARANILAVLAEFVVQGGRMVDSSPMYGRAESIAGELMTALSVREKMFVATKVWTRGADTGIAQMRDSIQKLATPTGKPIDLMQVHNLVDADVHLATLAQWKQEKKVRYFGITHYTESAYASVAALIEKQKTKTIDFLQINYSVAEREAEKRLLPLAVERGIAVIINRPFAGGELLRQLHGKPLPKVAEAVGATSWAQLLLKFVIAQRGVTCAIPATSKVSHLIDNMGAGRGLLPDEAMRKQIIAALTH